jgi:ACS family sodium-dependent inorganic phosphate cotransporter-like MFS transporter 5
MGMFFASFPVGIASDYLVNSGCVSTVAARKIFNSIGFLGAAAGMIWLSFVGCDSTMAVVALVAANTINAASYAGFNASQMLQSSERFSL